MVVTEEREDEERVCCVVEEGAHKRCREEINGESLPRGIGGWVWEWWEATRGVVWRGRRGEGWRLNGGEGLGRFFSPRGDYEGGSVGAEPHV